MAIGEIFRGEPGISDLAESLKQIAIGLIPFQGSVTILETSTHIAFAVDDVDAVLAAYDQLPKHHDGSDGHPTITSRQVKTGLADRTKLQESGFYVIPKHNPS